jgi:DNA-binding NtrC family response regulator
VRELKNIIERAVLIGDGPEVKMQDMGIAGSAAVSSGPLDLPVLSEKGVDLEAVENSVQRYYIETALTLSDGNETQAARLLGMNHHTFRYRRRKLKGEGQ